MQQLRNKPCHQSTLDGKNDSALACATLIFLLCTVAFALVFLGVALEALGSLVAFDFRYSATNDNYIYNTSPANDLDWQCTESASDYDTEYALSDNNIGMRSDSGLYLNRGITSPDWEYGYWEAEFDDDLSSFTDHDTNTVSMRLYVNPLSILESIQAFYFSYITTGDRAWNIEPACQPTGTSGVKIVYHIFGGGGARYYYYGSSLPLITSPTWVDVSYVFQVVRGSNAIIKMSENIYSSGYKSGSLPQITSDFACQDDDLDELTNTFFFELENFHYVDITIQYVNIFGGETTADYLGTLLCANPTIVPPEYCSNPSTAFLANGYTDAVGNPCKAPFDSNYCPSTVSTPSSSYSSPKLTDTLLGVTIGIVVISETVFSILFIVLFICLI